MNWEKGGTVGGNNHLLHTWRQLKSQPRTLLLPLLLVQVLPFRERIVLCLAYYPF